MGAPWTDVATTLPPLVPVEELVRFVGDPALDEGRAAQALASASALVRAETRQELTWREGDEWPISPHRQDTLLLPERPVTLVTSVTVRGQLLDTRDYEWSRWGVLRCRRGYTFPDGLDIVVVTYDHGYAPLPGELIWLGCSVAARMLDVGAATGVTQEVIGTYTVGYRTPGWTADERVVLDRYRQ